jgi:leucyl aminopeptidase
MSRNGTLFDFVAGEKPAPSADVLLVPLPAKPQPPLELVARVDAVCDDAVSELLAVKAVGDELGHVAHTTRSGAYRRVVVVSLGDGAKLTPLAVRKAGAAAAHWLMSAKIGHVALWVDGLAASGIERAAGEWVAGMLLAGFRFLDYRKPDPAAVGRVRVQVCSSEPGNVRRLLPDIREEAILAEAINYARQLSHQPGNVINPTTLAAEARTLAQKCKLNCTILNTAQLRKLGMGGLLAVGAGASEGPCLIQLEYRAAPRSHRKTILVGKAVTFDTGGYSIKPASSLPACKFDKCGGATVMGALKAAAALKLKCNLVGLVVAAENAISERAYRPSDILKTMSGKTVEVTTTDGEGRLMLCDALWYAQTTLKPTEMIDLATLTGGAGLALGRIAGGMMSNDDELAGELGECGRRTGERLWRLPLWDEYRELIAGTEADLKNASTKTDARTIVGGMFLKEFIKPGMAWAHLDIAAVATSDDDRPPTGKGATGFGVRLLVDYLRRRGA